MKLSSKVFGIVTAIVICTLIILALVWWANGRDDTWLYVTSGIIVLTSYLPVLQKKKDTDQ